MCFAPYIRTVFKALLKNVKAANRYFNYLSIFVFIYIILFFSFFAVKSALSPQNSGCQKQVFRFPAKKTPCAV